ncbi:hypothetical protein AGABI2DRAFT_123161 [Agaricus bisporus var. bisporus H97]|uniref:hypothetical protein n=1 Tax=Agaricus bisporus var. bisporus (strain H97 / ATCC MYA-4626 / FGSC 10389) TaxID=936046 RepID=UPI00029F5FAF|nr:hypothetical protein AGABI2DRAFT_123161 [Agaricus bisporus var. bisporus H97]EKV42033.1 hypothetical protein AGABI2DRAFT_123161 [Agaricus bisporus var. bisporus H97]
MFVSLAQFRQMATFLSREQLAGMIISIDDLLNLPPSVLSAPNPTPADLIIFDQYTALIQARLAPLSRGSVPTTPAPISARLPEHLTAPSSRVSPVFRSLDLPPSSQAMEVDPGLQSRPRPRPVGAAAVQRSGTMPPPSYSSFGSPARRLSPAPEALTIQIPPLSRVSSQNSAKRRREGSSPPPQEPPPVREALHQDTTPSLPKVTVEDPIELTEESSDEDDSDYVDGASKKGKARSRREIDLVESTGLSLGGDPLASILEVFSFPRVEDRPANPCLNCLTRFLPTCTHGTKQFQHFPLGPLSWSEAQVQEEKDGAFIKDGACDTCLKKHIPHCDHAKPPCLTQFIAESVQPTAMLAGTNLKRRIRDTQVAISQAKFAKMNDCMCQINARLSIMELAMDLSSAFKFAAKPPSFWVEGGYFRSEAQYELVYEAAFYAAARAVDQDDDQIQAEFELHTMELFAAHCTILEWLGELSSSSEEGNWRWYTTPDEEGSLHFPMDNSFLKRNQAAIARFKASKNKAKSGGGDGDKQV